MSQIDSSCIIVSSSSSSQSWSYCVCDTSTIHGTLFNSLIITLIITIKPKDQGVTAIPKDKA